MRLLSTLAAATLSVFAIVATANAQTRESGTGGGPGMNPAMDAKTNGTMGQGMSDNTGKPMMKKKMSKKERAMMKKQQMMQKNM